MEKITKEELMEKLGGVALSDDALENVSGGWNGKSRDCGMLERWSDELQTCVYVGIPY